MRERQGWWFFPLLVVEALNLQAQSFATGFSRRSGKWQPVEMSLLTLRWAAYLSLLLIVLDPGIAAAFLGVQLAVVGIYLGCTFAPNHKGMPVLPPDVRIDFLRRQVLMSRNIISNRLTTFAMGGLNYQIEHHLFPSMPRPNLRRAQRLIKPFCIENSVTYTETTLRTVLRHRGAVPERRRAAGGRPVRVPDGGRPAAEGLSHRARLSIVAGLPA